jgi:FKBP-type peptidyl-prolyl cis-trans isomerase 2
MTKVKKTDKIKVNYTGKLDTGDVFDSSQERGPLEFVVGDGKLIPAFEEAVIGLGIKESTSVKIPCDKAYGQVQDELFYEVDNSKLPEGLSPKKGMELVSKTPEGQEVMVVVSDVKDSSVVIDANHPLAGEDLTFEIEVVEIM